MRAATATLRVVFLLLCGCDAEPPLPAGSSEAEDVRPRDGDQALEWLLAGNERFVSGRPRHDHEGILRRALLSAGQHPFAAVLGCSDSRVPPELVFDHGLGDLFVIRVAGNVVAEDEAGSLEYAVEHLDVPLVLVLGHEGCGAVTAAFGSKAGESPELARLLRRLDPALAGIDPALPLEERIRQGVEANVRQSVGDLEFIAERDAEQTPAGLRIVGAVYQLETGRVRVLD